MFPKPLMASGSMGAKKLGMGRGRGPNQHGAMGELCEKSSVTSIHAASGFSYLNRISMMDGHGLQITDYNPRLHHGVNLLHF